MFILIGEYEGDYEDFYQRASEVIAISQLRKKIIEEQKSDDCKKYVATYILEMEELI